MSTQDNQPLRIFISYSWTDADHEDWVLKLAQRLDAYHEFDVTLDKWELRLGQDVNAFTERLASESKKVDKVLIICDKDYVDKANKRERGVGREVQIISNEVYPDINQTKFIPIIRQWKTKEEPYLPIFLKTRFYIDFADDAEFEVRLQQLIGDLTNQPRYQRPAKTQRLSHSAKQPSVNVPVTSQLFEELDSLLITRPQLLPTKISTFLNAFYQELSPFTFVITDPSTLVVGKQIIDQITAYTPLRDVFLGYFTKLLEAHQLFDIDLLIRFFGRLYGYTQLSSPTGGAVYTAQADQYRFIVYELFLSTMGLFLKHEQFTYVTEMLYSAYHKPDRWEEKEPQSYRIFYLPITSIEAYYQTIKVGTVSFEDLLLERVSPLVMRDDLVQADLLCYSISELNEIYPADFLLDSNWFPATFFCWREVSLPVFTRITSVRYFNKVRGIYAASSPGDLAAKIDDYEQKHTKRRPDSTGRGIVPPIYRLIESSTIGRDH